MFLVSVATLGSMRWLICIRDQEPEVVEQSKVVERLIPGNYYYIGISKDNQLVAMGKRGLIQSGCSATSTQVRRRAQSHGLGGSLMVTS